MSNMLPRESAQLEGRVAIVFGGGCPDQSVNLGQAAVLAYLNAGARVAIVDASEANARRTKQVAGAPGRTMTLVADITDERNIEGVIEQVADRFKSIDVVHNNVGIPRLGNFQSFTQQDWLDGLSVNCIGAAMTMRSSLPHLIKSGGCVINVSSVASIRYTGMNYAIYNTAKAALDQMTVAFALEHAGRGVRANSILPGLLDTEMGRGLAAGERNNQRDNKSPTGRQGSVWDIANAAVFLASKEAAYINGHLLVVDGGLSRRI